MRSEYAGVRVIGFDLDLTLYPRVEGGDELIQAYIHEQVAAYKRVSREEAKVLFDGLYKSGPGMSGRKALETLGLPRASGIIQEALEKADIAAFLKPDETTSALLRDLADRYRNIDLITGSSSTQARRKLDALGIPQEAFRHYIADEDAQKSDGSAYALWMGLHEGMRPEGFLYIGDNASTDYAIAREFGIRSVLVNCPRIDEGVLCPQLATLAGIRDLLL